MRWQEDALGVGRICVSGKVSRFYIGTDKSSKRRSKQK